MNLEKLVMWKHRKRLQKPSEDSFHIYPQSKSAGADR